MQAVLTEWVNVLEAWALPLSITFTALFVFSLLLAPYMVAKIPVDYFAHPKGRRPRKNSRHAVVQFVFISLKNILGVLLLILGIIMLFGPGPGLVTILLGVSMMNFPGKYRMERWIITRPKVLGSVNALRKKNGHPPLICDC